MATNFLAVLVCSAYVCGPHALDASGSRPVAGRTCAAPRSVPLGTRLYIEGVGDRTVTDRTARCVEQMPGGPRIDLFFGGAERRLDALRWGVQRRRIYTIDP